MFGLISQAILYCTTNPVTQWFKLKHAAHKIFTVGLVLFYYAQMEQVPVKKRLA